MSEIHKKENENFLDYAERLIDNRQEYDLDKVEIYEALYGTQASSDHCRKALTTLKMTIEQYKKDKTEQIMESDNENKDLELKKNYKETNEIKENGVQVSDKLLEMSEEDLKNPKYLLEKHGFDGNIWEISSAKNSIWNMPSKKDGKKTLYSSKITVKPAVDKFNPEWVKEVLENLDLESPKIDSLSNYDKYGKTLEVNIADAHIDKLCNLDETRNEYSTDIGIKRLWNVIESIIAKVEHLDIKKIIFPFGQDTANIDNMFLSTNKGTPQDTDVKYDILYKTLLENIIKIVHRLTDLAPVEVIYVGGNHDRITSFTMCEAMYWHFLNNARVSVDSAFNNRKYRLIGDNLLGLGHGADEKRNIIYCMQNDVPDLWGISKYREFHLSHFHKEIAVDEKNGIVMRWLSAISGTDAWTHNSGYVGSSKKAQAFVWDDKDGLDYIIYSVVK